MSSNSIIIKLFNSNQTENKFLKNTKIQNFTIFENFQFFFQIFLRHVNNHDGCTASQKYQKNALNYLSSVQLEVTFKKNSEKK